MRLTKAKAEPTRELATLETQAAADSSPPMFPQKQTAASAATFRERVLVLGALALLIWIAHFWRSSEFGLYEDDWAFVGHPMGWEWSQVAAWVLGAIRTWWVQGRPVGFAATALSVFIGNRIGGLEAVYIFAFLLHVLNAQLVFLLAARKLSTAPAFCAALAFALLPSDTSVPLLTNGLFMGFATLFLLTALLLYLHGMHAIAYLVSLGSLLTFESAFLPFFAAPLLGRWSRGFPRRLLKHWLLLLVAGGVTFFLRSRMGEAKTSAVLADGIPGTLHRIAVAITLGPSTTLSSSFHRAWFLVSNPDREALIVMAVFVAGLSILLCFLRHRRSGAIHVWPGSIDLFGYRLHVAVKGDPETAAALQTGLCGLAMLIMAYGLAISSDTYPPVTQSGRLSGCTHMAAATGFGLLVGSVASFLLDLAAGRQWKAEMALLLAGYFGVLGSFHYLVQRDFATSWMLQRTFWRSVVRECPDLADGTVLLFEDYSHPLRFVETNSWADPHVLPLLYRFPHVWSDPPRLFPVTPNWRAEIVDRSGKLVLSSPFGAWPDRPLRDGSVILLKGNNLGVRRITGSVKVGTHELRLKPFDNPTLQRLPPGPLYRYVLQSE